MVKKIAKFLCVFFLSTTKISAQAYYQIIYDNQQSQVFGAQNISTLHHALYSFEDKYIRDTLCHENTFIKKTGGIGYRLVKGYFLDFTIDYLLPLAQHEAFGHGARFREMGYENNSFNINLPKPFGSGGGFAKSGTLKIGYKNPTPQEIMVISAGGVESNKVLADNLTSQILLSDTLHYRQSLLYIIAQNNLLFYLGYTRYNYAYSKKFGNDMISYTNRINQYYTSTVNNNYNIEKLSNQSFISFINPIQVYSLFSLVYSYGIKGNKGLCKIPMFKFKNVRYLPAFNFSLTPFGSQYHFVNYVRYKTILLTGDFTLGDATYNRFYGFSFKGYNILNTKKITLNTHLDIWNQPPLELENYTQPIATNSFGGLIKTDILIRPFNHQNRVGSFIQIGYKTKGFIIGETLDKSFILRYGLSLKL